MEEDVNAHDTKISGYQVFRCRRQRTGDRCVRGEDPGACGGTRATSGGSGRCGTGATAAQRAGSGSGQSRRHGRGWPAHNSSGCRLGTCRRHARGRSGGRRPCGWAWRSTASGSTGTGRDAGSGDAGDLRNTAVA